MKGEEGEQGLVFRSVPQKQQQKASPSLLLPHANPDWVTLVISLTSLRLCYNQPGWGSTLTG